MDLGHHDDPAMVDSSLEASEEGSNLSDQEEQSWIAWFCSIRGNEFFVEVDEDYIQDEFNLTGLSAEVPYFDYALDTILDVDSPNADALTEEQQETVDAAAELLYGLIHARYILTSKGLNAMYEKFMDGDFGRCPRVMCGGQAVLPVGQADLPRRCTVSLYCPRCSDVYHPRSGRHANVDGAYFGTTFPHLFLMTYPQFVPEPCAESYVPRVFGFRIRRAPIPEEPITAAAAMLAASGGRAAAAGAAGAGSSAGDPGLDTPPAVAVAGASTASRQSPAGSSPLAAGAHKAARPQVAPGSPLAAGSGLPNGSRAHHSGDAAGGAGGAMEDDNLAAGIARMGVADGDRDHRRRADHVHAAVAGGFR